MEAKVFYIAKSSNTSADTLLAVGFASLLGYIYREIYGTDDGIFIQDAGPYYEITLPLPIDTCNLPRLRDMPVLLPLDSEKQREKQGKKGKGEKLDGFNYDTEIDKSKSHRERVKNLSPHLQTADARLRREPGLEEIIPDEPDTRLAHYQAISQMKIASSFNELALRWRELTEEQIQLHMDLLFKLFSNPDNDVTEAETTWQNLAREQKIPGKVRVTALQIVNPTAGKGANRTKASELAVGNQESFWILELLKFKGFMDTTAPLVIKDKVIVGVGGGEYGIRGFIAAYDAATGKEAWRFYTIARPDEHGGGSWNGLPLEKRNGASVWIPGSYDPVQNLAFFGPGNTYDTGPLRNLVNQPGVTNDGLYLDSTLALNPDTGKLAWYFQHQANGQWDLDWAFERMVVQLPVNGDTRSVVVTAGKQMIFDIVEAETGKYVSSIDLGLQNLVTSIDPKTGAKITDPALLPGDGQTKMVCPHVSGGRGWMPTSYDTATRILYVPIVEACMDLVPVGEGERGSLSTGVRWTVRPRPGSDGKYGRLQALNLETKKTAWIERQRAPLTTGTLATAGGVVFTGSLDRMFLAYDAATGAQIWKARLNDVPSSAPISYSANGQEYVAIVVGPGGYQSNSYDALVPEIQNPPDHGAAIWVFEVPTKPAVKVTR